MRIPKNAKVPVHPISAAGVLAVIALACCSLVRDPNANAADATPIGGTKAIYGNIAPDQIESLSTADRIKSVTSNGSSNMAIWEALEHGEKVECTDCIRPVADLLYNSNPRTREIAAWWLRRRIYGVFGPGEVYEQTVKDLAGNPDPVRRAYAAEALGEFLAFPGVEACANAAKSDPDGLVRASAVGALGRLNDPGNGAIAQAFGDPDSRVKLAALRSAGRINGFKDGPAMTRMASDGDAKVRRNAAEMLGTLRVQAGFDSLAAMARDPDPEVRNAAAHSLGALHDGRARDLLSDLAQNDPNTLVRDQATIALRRL